MINGFASLDRIRSEQEYKELVELARKDNHGVFAPTHIVRKHGEKVGYFSVGSPGVPVVLAWLHTEKVLSRESMSLINSVENHVAMNGASAVCFPVPKESPFHCLMEKMGYRFAGSYDMFVKEV